MTIKDLKLTDILLIIIGCILLYNSFFIKEADNIKKETVVIPRESNTTGTQYIEPKVVVVQVPVGKNEVINVDSYWKSKYENATEQKVKDSLYNEAIKINKYKDTVVEDDRITIIANATTRGSLLDYKVDYILNEHTISYTPKLTYKRPKLTLDLQQGVLLPSNIDFNFNLPLQIGLTNQKGYKVGYQYNLRGNQHGFYFGKSFTIIK